MPRRSVQGGTGRPVAVLALLAAVAPLAIDMYAPGFPGIAGSFGTGPVAVQLSLTAFLVGLAGGQLVLGPLSDATGRRPPLLVGSGLFTVFSVLCALAPSVATFDVSRLLQGVAGSAGLVVGRAVVTDRWAGTRAARPLATLSSSEMTVPVLAPVAGGLVLEVGSWRLVFAVLGAVGLAAALAGRAWVPETLPPARRRGGGARGAVGAMGGLLRRRVLLGHLLVTGFGLAALFGYVAGSPFVFQGGYGLSPTAYSLVFAGNAVGTVLAGVLFGRLAGRVRVNSLLVAGVAVATGCAAALVGLVAGGVDVFPVTWACLFGVAAGIGVVLPAATTLILAVGGDAPGAASGLLGGAQFVLGAVAAPLPGVLGHSTALSTGAVVLGCLLLASVALLTLARPWRGHGEPPGRP